MPYTDCRGGRVAMRSAMRCMILSTATLGSGFDSAGDEACVVVGEAIAAACAAEPCARECSETVRPDSDGADEDPDPDGSAGRARVWEGTWPSEPMASMGSFVSPRGGVYGLCCVGTYGLACTMGAGVEAVARNGDGCSRSNTLGFWRLRRAKYQRSPATSAMNASPPMTPPAMAPAFVFELPEEFGAFEVAPPNG